MLYRIGAMLKMLFCRPHIKAKSDPQNELLQIKQRKEARRLREAYKMLQKGFISPEEYKDLLKNLSDRT